MTEEELRRQTEREIRIMVFFKLLPWMILILVFCVGLLKGCICPRAPMEDRLDRSREVVRQLAVCDTTRNGFLIVYATSKAVTWEQLGEIRLREPLNKAFDNLRDSAAAHFGGSLLQVDIYDFAAYARHFDVDRSVRMHNIFVYGAEKQKMYIGDNPRITNPATWLNVLTEQGVQYIKEDDIYFRMKKDQRVYRYWKCYGNNAISRTDERYSHFSEDERLW